MGTVRQQAPGLSWVQSRRIARKNISSGGRACECGIPRYADAVAARLDGDSDKKLARPEIIARRHFHPSHPSGEPRSEQLDLPGYPNQEERDALGTAIHIRPSPQSEHTDVSPTASSTLSCSTAG